MERQLPESKPPARVAVFGTLRIPAENIPDILPHLQAAHIGPWRDAARAHGLMERVFHSYDIHSTLIAV